MTDQQRSLQHFPEKWVREYLPNYSFFLDNGVNFVNNICNTSPCGPSRASLFTGLYPAKNGITGNMGTVLPEDMNFTRVLIDAGYDIFYKGKLHMNEDFTSFSTTWPEDPATAPKMAEGEDLIIEKLYGIQGWTSPDFGTSLVRDNPTSNEIANLAGGSGHNDSRVVTGEYQTYKTQESVLEFLARVQKTPPDKPFCLVVSLLNPHDVSLYPNGWQQAGYQNALFDHYEDFMLPESYYLDDLSTKPRAQAAYLNVGCGGKLEGSAALSYVKFYAYLHTLSDRLHSTIFDAIGDDLRKNSYIIRMADHGEMGMAHGGLQEKTYTAYNETLKVPMIWYHEGLVGGEREEMVSLIDMVPTLGKLAGADLSKYPQLQGNDYSALLTSAENSEKVFDSVLFYGPGQAPGSSGGAAPDPSLPYPSSSTETNPNNAPYFAPSPLIPKGNQMSDYPDNIYAIVTRKGYKYAVYYALNASDNTVDWSGAQFELYDLNNDKNEINNLLPLNQLVSDKVIRLKEELHKELTELLTKNDILPAGWNQGDF
ncbi:MAG: hypothetical protein Roseis2KO_28490 [Roseivirga sp.]